MANRPMSGTVYEIERCEPMVIVPCVRQIPYEHLHRQRVLTRYFYFGASVGQHRARAIKRRHAHPHSCTMLPASHRPTANRTPGYGANIYGASSVPTAVTPLRNGLPMKDTARARDIAVMVAVEVGVNVSSGLVLGVVRASDHPHNTRLAPWLAPEPVESSA